MIEFRRLEYGEEAFTKAYELYIKSFPVHEQRLLNNQIEAMKEKSFRCEGIYENQDFVGIIFHWTNEEYSYVEHYAICPEYRGNNIGSRALTAFCEGFENVILEIDPPIDEISIRREGFYSRLGFKRNDYNHFHPPYRKGYEPHGLVLLSYPKAISEKIYNSFSEYLSKVIMSYSE